MNLTDTLLHFFHVSEKYRYALLLLRRGSRGAMKKLLIVLILCVVGNAHYTYSQSLIWERIFDIDYRQGSRDELIGLIIADTNGIFASVLSSKYERSTGFENPAILVCNSSGYVIDTIVNDDTCNGSYSAVDRSRKRLWIAYRTENYPFTRTVIEKKNYRGFTIVRKDFIGPDFIDSLPAYIYKLLPAQDGGFYMLAGRNRVISGQGSEPWQVSRWDSLGNRRWVKEYLYTYAYGQPQQAEFLPNGNLFVSGWAGREIMALEIDTATGRALNRKVLYTHPENVGWALAGVKRCLDGYIVSAYDSRNSSSVNRYFFGKFNDTLGRVWGARSSLGMGTMITPLTDSTFWIGTKVGLQNIYQRMGPDSTVLHSIVLAVDDAASPLYGTGVNYVAHFNDQSAVFGGTTRQATTQGSALYLCKIDSIGTPFNPVYPPVGPVPVATKNRIVEPDLQVFPNPFTHTLRISHKGTIQLLDIHGRKVMVQAVEAGQELNTGSLPRGMYLLRFTSSAGKGYVRKVVRE